jgi:hypothetical protein
MSPSDGEALTIDWSLVVQVISVVVASIAAVASWMSALASKRAAEQTVQTARAERERQRLEAIQSVLLQAIDSNAEPEWYRLDSMIQHNLAALLRPGDDLPTVRGLADSTVVGKAHVQEALAEITSAISSRDLAEAPE